MDPLSECQARLSELAQELERERRAHQRERLETVARLAGGIAHDLNNHLTVIQGYLELAEGKAEPPLARYLNRIGSAAQDTTLLVRQLLAFARRQVLSPQPTDLRELVGRVATSLQPRLGGATLSVELPEALGVVEVDVEQLGGVIEELLLNASAALRGRSGRIVARLRDVELDPDQARQLHPELPPGAYVLVEVCDDGEGISQEVLDHAFEPFFTTREGKRVGLGLSTVYGVVKQSGGWVWIDGAPGQGTTVTIYLPRSQAAAAPLRAQEDRAELPRGAGETVLVVDDQALVRAFARDVLERLGYEVREAKDGVEALALLGGGLQAALLLSDVVMPGMGGFQLFQAAAARWPGLPVVFMSGHPGRLLTDGLDERRIDCPYLRKPFTAAQLARLVRATIDARS
ncbi:MAG: ATP-binding protein [Planctomycetota bacterium]